MPVLSKASWAAVRTILAAAGPLQSLVDRPSATHLYISREAVDILKRDGLRRQAALLSANLEWLQRGVSWADTGWKNVAHYFNPNSCCGINLWPSAAAECERYFSSALACWRRGQLRRAMFFLGAAVHLVQDLCVPYHAGGVPFSGHQAFERWAEDHCGDYPPEQGIYGNYDTPAGWVAANAAASIVYLPDLMSSSDAEVFHRVSADMLPLAQRTTAGFYAFFLEKVGC